MQHVTEVKQYLRFDEEEGKEGFTISNSEKFDGDASRPSLILTCMHSEATLLPVITYSGKFNSDNPDEPKEVSDIVKRELSTLFYDPDNSDWIITAIGIEVGSIVVYIEMPGYGEGLRVRIEPPKDPINFDIAIPTKKSQKDKGEIRYKKGWIYVRKDETRLMWFKKTEPGVKKKLYVFYNDPTQDEDCINATVTKYH